MINNLKPELLYRIGTWKETVYQKEIKSISVVVKLEKGTNP